MTDRDPSSSFLKMATSETSYGLFKRNTFCKSVMPQDWSVPEPIMVYSAINPSTPKVYQKMIQTCKYFFGKNPIIYVPKFLVNYNGDQRKWFFKVNENVIDIEKITSKFWVPELIRMNAGRNDDSHRLFSSFTPKLYQSQIAKMFLNSKTILFNDLKVLSPSCETLCLDKVTVTRSLDIKNSVVAFEKVFDLFLNVKNFTYTLPIDSLPNTIITTNTIKELSKFPHFQELELFSITNCTEIAGINDFFGYMKDNTTTRIFLNYREQISMEYKEQLQTIVHNILGTHDHGYKIPGFKFEGMSDEAFFKLQNLGRNQKI